MKRAILCGALWSSAAAGHCAMCYRNVQSLSQARGKVVNSAILVLGTPPLLLIAGFAVLITRRRRDHAGASVSDGQNDARL